MAPPEDLPQSMEAFSQLQRPPTDAMANRPTTDVMKGPPVTEMMPRGYAGAGGAPAPRIVPIDASTGASEGRLAAVPQAVANRARPEDAAARTQFDSNPGVSLPPPPPLARPVVVGAQTDLNTARDTSVMALREATAPTKPRSPLIYGLPLVALLAIGGVLGVVSLKGKGASKDPSGSQPPPSGIVAVPAETPVTNTTPPPPSATPSADPSAKLAAVPSASASVVRNGTRPPTTVTTVRTSSAAENAATRGLNQ